MVLLAGVLLIGACSSDDGGDDAGGGETTDGTTEGTDVTTTTALAGDDYRTIVETLADDGLEGRDNQSPGSEAAQTYLTGLLEEFTEPLPDAPDGYAWPFAEGTNLIGMIPGGDKADEYLLIGGHYDHVGTDCPSNDPADTVCNGAADNAAGTASAVEVGRALAAAGPERTVIVALWDAEEDGLLGAEAYVDDPAVPLADTVAYLNWDIQGTNLTPSLADTTVVVGAETGGPNLIAASETATEASDLQALDLSLLFGQGRSDHAPFAAAGVPVVFYTDANNSCYHTAQDDLTTIDFDKLGRQIPIGTALAEDLAATDEPPEFDAAAPAASFADAESMLAVIEGGRDDFQLFGADGAASAEAYLTDLEAMVDAGEAAFDEDAVSRLLGGAVEVVELLTTGECTGFLDQ
jgi:hypothetical protein